MKKILPLFCFSFLVFYPFAKFIIFHGYPILTIEVLLPAVLVFFFFFITSVVWSRFKGVEISLLVAVLYIFLTTGPVLLSPHKLILLAVGMLFLFFILYKIHSKMWGLVLFFIIGLLASDIGLFFLHQEPKPSAVVPLEGQKNIKDESLGPVLYIILDEHIGLDGLPSDVPASLKMKDDFKNFFLNYYFTLYSKAYSPYFYTDNSISNTLNFTYSKIQGEYFGDFKGRDERPLKQNKLFEYYFSKGYKISVYEPNYMDFCSELVADCFKVKRNSPVALIGEPYSLLEKEWLMGSLFLSNNSLFQEIEKRLPNTNIFKTKAGPLKMVGDTFSQLKKDIKPGSNPHFYFAHILTPHYPYVYDAQCTPRPMEDWVGREEFANQLGLMNSPKGYELRYTRYYDQMRCTHRHLSELFDSLKLAGLYDKITIIIHGDHGSRINKAYDPYFDYKDKISDQDMVTSHSTLLAIKRPYQAVGVLDPTQDDIIAVLKGFVFNKEVVRDDNFVYLKQKKGKKELIYHPMPNINL